MTTCTKIAEYINGNIHVTILNDGTKIREYGSIPNPEFPESIDVKITNFCDLECPYCHEASSEKGKVADSHKAINLLFQLPKGIEIAIGGGNPLAVPDLTSFLVQLKAHDLICNMTVNAKHIQKYKETLKFLIDNNLIYGLGISASQNITIPMEILNDNTVLHFIMGIDSPTNIPPEKKILILGYKNYKRGMVYYNNLSILVNENIRQWNINLPEITKKSKIVSFDNLAIEQLFLKNRLSKQVWDTFYMGDDGQFSMYLDLVKMEYAKSSIAERHPIKGSIKNIFQKIRRNINGRI